MCYLTDFSQLYEVLLFPFLQVTQLMLRELKVTQLTHGMVGFEL